jgi:nicotinamidase/pyrazinamidase
MKTLEILIAIDPTNSFCPGGELPVTDGDKIMPVINRLTKSKKFDAAILVTEEHPKGHISFASSHPGKKIFDTILLPGGHTQILWPDHSLAGTKGCKPHPALELTGFTHRLIKGQFIDADAHSGFRDNDKKKETGLRELILSMAQQQGIPPTRIRLTIVGLALDYCVGLTALDAREYGFRTRVLVDATRSVAVDSELEMLKQLAAQGVELSTSREILRSRERVVGRGNNLSLKVGVL